MVRRLTGARTAVVIVAFQVLFVIAGSGVQATTISPSCSYDLGTRVSGLDVDWRHVAAGGYHGPLVLLHASWFSSCSPWTPLWRDNTANVAGGGANQEYLTDAVALSRSLGIVVAGAADGNVKFYGFGSQVPFSSYLLDATNETMAVDIAPTPNAVFPPVVAGGGRTLAAFDSAGILRWQLESLGNPGSRIVSLEMSDPGKYIAVGQESLVDGPAQVHLVENLGSSARVVWSYQVLGFDTAVVDISERGNTFSSPVVAVGLQDKNSCWLYDNIYVFFAGYDGQWGTIDDDLPLWTASEGSMVYSVSVSSRDPDSGNDRTWGTYDDQPNHVYTGSDAQNAGAEYNWKDGSRMGSWPVGSPIYDGDTEEDFQGEFMGEIFWGGGVVGSPSTYGVHERWLHHPPSDWDYQMNATVHAVAVSLFCYLAAGGDDGNVSYWIRCDPS